LIVVDAGELIREIHLSIFWHYVADWVIQEEEDDDDD
jgi:hypothetical protein